MRINSTNLKQFEGGAVVKQGDSASLFGYELLDEQMRPIRDLNGKNATIRIFNQKGKATFESTVDKSKVTFKISKPLPIGSYLVEVVCDGYIQVIARHAWTLPVQQTNTQVSKSLRLLKMTSRKKSTSIFQRIRTDHRRKNSQTSQYYTI